MIEQRADVNQKNKDEDFSLKMAFMCGNQELVKYLIEQGADINQKDKHGNTLLHFLALENNEDMLIYLIKKKAIPLSIC